MRKTGKVSLRTNVSEGQASYGYDGSGQRVTKSNNGLISTLYVYNIFGNLAAEYNSFGAQQSPCAICYLSYDHLGSVRMVTDNSPSANIIARHDYLPFGEEIPANTAGRRSEWGPFSDKVDQKFTGQERDDETGFDFFQARYFYGIQGRFNSPDPGNAGADPSNPQSWNGYSYVLNNPLNLVDPNGTDVCSDGSYADACVTASPDPVSTDSSWWFWSWLRGWGPGVPTFSVTHTETLPPPPSTPRQPPKSGIGIRAPGQTFQVCMAQHANEYSLGGLVDTSYGLATGKDSSVSTNPLASFVLGNSINTLLFGSGGETASAALSDAPSAITGGVGNALTYGRRTSDIMALNLAGRGGLPVALGRSSAGVKAAVGKAGSFLSLGLSFAERMGLDVAFTGAEAVDCSMIF
jgi:RHS repeat-associated protein